MSVVALLGIAAAAWFFLEGQDSATTQVRTPTPAVTLAPSTPTPEPPPSEQGAVGSAPPSTGSGTAEPYGPVPPAADASVPEVTEEVEMDMQEAARIRLEELRDESVPYLSLDGHWVVVLSTKKSGVEDASQTARNGSHVFYDDDILSLHEDLADLFSSDADVLLIRSSDFGKQPRSGDVFWRTIVDRGFHDKEQAADWCNQHFTGTAKDIENACLPKPLVPPSQS
ncbi:hypothetical protein [Tessaracoccus sp.]